MQFAFACLPTTCLPNFTQFAPGPEIAHAGIAKCDVALQVVDCKNNSPGSSLNWLRHTIEKGQSSMGALLETLATKLPEWKPETASQVRARVTGIIALADEDAHARLA
jgi:hypothetical protein